MAFYKVNCFSIEIVSWEKKPLFEVAEDTVCIWQIRIEPEIRRIEKLSALLKPDELDRANRYHYEKDRIRFITSRGSLRMLLSNYLKKEPGDIEFTMTPDKKPCLKHPFNNLKYNTSHSENYALIAIGSSEVGVDIEKTDSSFDWNSILHSSFSKNEIEWVKQSKMPKDSFYLLWTRKEALAKATGKGLQDDLTIFPSLDGLHNLSADDFFNSSWEVSSFKIDNYTIGSVACHPTIIDRKFYQLNFDNFRL